MKTFATEVSLSILLISLILNTEAHYAVEKETVQFVASHGHNRGRSQRNQANNESNPPAPPPTSPERLVFADQRLAVVYPVIQKFKSIITSDPLGVTKSWVGSDVCNYTGFYCESPPNNASAMAVASVDFNGFKLGAPTLDGFLDQLSDLALFHANSNNFAGTISPNVAKLRYLYELDISNNGFSGSFPNAVLGMESLTFLDIRFNFFTGSVPPQIFFMQNLDALFINNNDFMQKLPDNLGTSHILYLTLANNKFIGPIPSTIAKLFSSLTEVLLLNNQLTGCLPYEIGFLKEAIVFDIGNNQLTGPLPSSLACLDKVEQLNFAGNFLYGMVPEVVCVLENLANFSLSDNYFIYVGPVCRGLIESGVLDVRRNCIPGLPNQRSIEECVAFFAYPKRLLCPYKWSYNHIPCELPHFSSRASLSPTDQVSSPP
ncbi:LRR domain containing protein [Parasponia andersonii]|uniref:LRR domain containing protein n=1 Tax=Parasponia andersonii TaxID=3476 RepID=A0A2P5CVK9_PARAD|nr:LRR domain containing protein [Parasponia andersonii]